MSASDKLSSREQSDLDRLDALIETLSPLADALDSPPMCWVGNGGDEGQSYCFACCRAFVDTSNFMMARSVDDGWEVDGGWDPARESDGSETCCRCGCTLGYSLTSAGMYEEIAHFEDVIRDGFSSPLRDEDAYAVRAIAEAAIYSDDLETMAAAVAIGGAAVAALMRVAA